MELIFPSKRRDALLISIAILKAARKGIRKTHLINTVSLNHEQSIRYITFLKGRGLIEEHDHSYQTTENGLELLHEFDSASLLRSILTD